MGVFAMILLALGMSMDAFAAALARGAVLPKKTHFGQILRTGSVFGLVEMCAPLVGFALGSVAADLIREWDHWVAFILLAGLGLRMIYEGVAGEDEEVVEVPSGKQNALMLVFTAIGTSIDSMIVGVGLAFLAVNIWTSAISIGLATTIMATLGLWLGRFLGDKIGKWAEIAGGLVLIGIGAAVLIDHLGLFQAA
ncbi:manganese efflux pump MntP family protein [Neisseriaceae bacterium B1]